MKQRPAGRHSSSEQIIKYIKRKTRNEYSGEEKIRIVLDGLRGEDSIAELHLSLVISRTCHHNPNKKIAGGLGRLSPR